MVVIPRTRLKKGQLNATPTLRALLFLLMPLCLHRSPLHTRLLHNFPACFPEAFPCMIAYSNKLLHFQRLSLFLLSMLRFSLSFIYMLPNTLTQMWGMIRFVSCEMILLQQKEYFFQHGKQNGTSIRLSYFSNLFLSNISNTIARMHKNIIKINFPDISDVYLPLFQILRKGIKI